MSPPLSSLSTHGPKSVVPSALVADLAGDDTTGLATAACPDAPASAPFAGVLEQMRSAMALGRRQFLAAPESSTSGDAPARAVAAAAAASAEVEPSGLVAIALSPALAVITTARDERPSDAELARFARSQGFDDSALRAIFASTRRPISGQTADTPSSPAAQGMAPTLPGAEPAVAGFLGSAPVGWDQARPKPGLSNTHGLGTGSTEANLTTAGATAAAAAAAANEQLPAARPRRVDRAKDETAITTVIATDATAAGAAQAAAGATIPAAPMVVATARTPSVPAPLPQTAHLVTHLTTHPATHLPAPPPSPPSTPPSGAPSENLAALEPAPGPTPLAVPLQPRSIGIAPSGAPPLALTRVMPSGTAPSMPELQAMASTTPRHPAPAVGQPTEEAPWRGARAEHSAAALTAAPAAGPEAAPAAAPTPVASAASRPSTPMSAMATASFQLADRPRQPDSGAQAPSLTDLGPLALRSASASSEGSPQSDPDDRQSTPPEPLSGSAADQGNSDARFALTAARTEPPASTTPALPTAAEPLRLDPLTNESLGQQAQRLGEALARRLAAQIRRGEWELRLSLTPQSLGHIDVQLKVQDQAIDARFQVSNTHTQALLQEGMPKLKETLNLSGMEIAAFVVTGGGAERNRGNPTPWKQASQREPNRSLQVEALPADLSPARAAVRTRDDGGSLDVLV